jgi:shikimate dehydrogenase
MSVASDRPDRYALVGHPVEHSRSPMIHQLFARQTGENLSYELIDADPAEFEVAVRGFEAAGGRGMNVTVPHKEAAFALSAVVGPEAEAARAVNTISFTQAGIRGDNTDGLGFIRDVTINNAQTIAARRVLLLGAGGAARGIVGPILAEQPAALIIANRTSARAQALAQDFETPEQLSVLSFDELAGLAAFDLVVNATSAGLHGEQPPFPGTLVNGETFCYDLAYSIQSTPFVRWAEAHGAGRAVQGWGMLVEQAAESFSIWRGKRPETEAILRTLKQLETAAG